MQVFSDRLIQNSQHLSGHLYKSQSCCFGADNTPPPPPFSGSTTLPFPGSWRSSPDPCQILEERQMGPAFYVLIKAEFAPSQTHHLWPGCLVTFIIHRQRGEPPWWKVVVSVGGLTGACCLFELPAPFQHSIVSPFSLEDGGPHVAFHQSDCGWCHGFIAFPHTLSSSFISILSGSSEQQTIWMQSSAERPS